MSNTYNIANLLPDNSQPDPKPYYIHSIGYQTDPETHIPDGCSLVSWENVTFALRLGPIYFWNNIESAVVRDSDNVPLYLIGDFFIR